MTVQRWDLKTSKEKMKTLRESDLAMGKELATLRNTSASYGRRLANLEPKKVKKFLEEAKDDASLVHSQYKLLILKQTVATEVVRVANKTGEGSLDVARAVIKAFDYPDDWWESRTEKTLGQWINELKNLEATA